MGSYGVDIENPFTLLGDEDEDPLQIASAPAPKSAAAAKVAKKPAETKPAPAKPAAPVQEQTARPESGRGRGEGRGPSRGGRGGGRGDYEESRPPRREGRYDNRGRGERPFEEGNGVATENGGESRPYGGRGQGENRGYGRGGRGRGGYEGSRPPRREYERHDGTGRGHETVKRGGAGKGNWGTEQEVPKEEVKTEVVPEEEVVAAEPEVVEVVDAPAAEEAPAAVEAEPEKEEVQELSLEEYEKQLAEKRAALNKTREVAAVDMSEFKGMKTYEKKDAEEDLLGLELSKKKEKAADKGKGKKGGKAEAPVVEVNFRVGSDEPRGGGGGRGGRGGRGPRGGRGEGAPRPQSSRGAGRGGRGLQGPAGQVPTIPIADDVAFPSLA